MAVGNLCIAVLLLSTAQVATISLNDGCHQSVDPQNPESYIHYGTAVIRAIEGNPGDIAFIGAEFITFYLVKEFPKSSFLKKLNTGIQCAETAYNGLTGISSWWRGKRSPRRPFDHKGRMNVTVVVGEYILQHVNVSQPMKAMLRDRFELIEKDPRGLPCEFDKYDDNDDGRVTEAEFHVAVEREGFWRENLLFKALSKEREGQGLLSEETFNKNAAELHQFMKFSKCRY